VTIVIAVIVLVVLLLIIGAAPMTRRFADGAEQEMKARMPGAMDVDVEREFKRPPDEASRL
jgi:hypothetical protein